MPARINMPHPLKSTGTRQIDRLIKALSPEYFQLDDRSKQDLINSAYEYAKMLRWHGPDGRPDDNWACFWEVETLTYMAILAALDTRQIRKEYDDLDAEFGLALERLPEKSPKDGDMTEIAPQYYRQLMDAVRRTAWRLETHYRNLNNQVPLKAQILQLIRKHNDFEYEPDLVEGVLQQLIAFHKGADDGLLPEKYQDFYDKTHVTDHRWGVKDRDDYDCILPDGTYTREKVRALFLACYNALVAVKNRARQLFDAEIQLIEQPEEVAPRRLEPHIALFIAFLNLFRHAQDSLNEIPRRHLDFYYDCVLGLTRKPGATGGTAPSNWGMKNVDGSSVLLPTLPRKSPPMIPVTSNAPAPTLTS
ncbi:MAG: hypothetical protein HUU01_18620 [Saprospiraceae bacterium]|nr:hypothetical protein [Saprospiraceae bacterium]